VLSFAEELTLQQVRKHFHYRPASTTSSNLSDVKRLVRFPRDLSDFIACFEWPDEPFIFRNNPRGANSTPSLTDCFTPVSTIVFWIEMAVKIGGRKNSRVFAAITQCSQT
jgi:hypothetical protein